ncbi:hypothetical protein BC834DRAFT_829253 [Gloeopeniophorella convolvens]|nr:hypothetical protein BC834DRAFT_829253 [Gloeopeniophorella convolvens]
MSILEAAIKTGAIQTANNLRIASLAIATYDYLWTLPAEYRFYRTWYRGNFRLSLVLFVLIRYSSITVLTLSNVGFFSTGFTAASCNRYYMLPPIFKVPQTMTSQAILGIRAYSISGRNRYPAAVLLSGYVVASTLQWFTNLYHRRVISEIEKDPMTVLSSCTGASTNPRAFISVWLFYLVAMLYDLLTLAISMGYLLKYRPQSP